MKAWLVHPLTVAALVTGLNALKPVAVDDAAYLLLARQIAAHPADPYGGELFWYAKPVPALHILAPPVVPYWLALGIRLFGEQVPILKLWLFPFPLVLCFAVRSLVGRFAPGYGAVAVPAVALSPLVLPLFGMMLDVPALALGLAALAVFVRGGAWSWIHAGLLAGLAMQTKYSAFVVPGVLGWYGLTHRRAVPALAAVLVSVLVFAGWEGWLFRRYGESHFLYHVSESTGEEFGAKAGRLFSPLVTYCGGLGFGFCLFALPVAGVKRGVVWGVVVLTLGLVTLLFLPYRDSVFLHDKNTGAVAVDLPGIVFTVEGAFFFLVLVLTGLPFLVRNHPNRTTWFLAGWLGLELVAYFVLSPFAAGRRVMGLGFVAAVAFFRAAAVLGRVKHVRPGRWVLPYGIALGLGLFAIDAWDARPEKVLAETAAGFVKDHGGGRTLFNGHWGFQYYCDREGMLPVVPGASQLEPGDWLVFPVVPDDVGFYRPYHGGAKFRIDPRYVTPEIEFTWRDWLSAQTIPTLYGGRYPVMGRDHPRLRVLVYRVVREWKPSRMD
jgi:hypothetical protein